jgi:hypothetical protein
MQSGVMYCNYEQWCSIVLQAIPEANYKLISTEVEHMVNIAVVERLILLEHSYMDIFFFLFYQR